jgi:CBS domain-containing protein
MANNPDWCHSLQGWYHTLNNWIRELDPQNVRLMTIFLDFRPVYGDKELYDQLRNNVARTYRLSPVLLKFLLQDALLKKVPVNLFRQIQTERSGEYRNMLNLKTAACVHIVDCTRVFILHEGLLETNTFERLQKIEKLKLLNRNDLELVQAAYETLMMLRIRDAMAKMRKGVDPDNYIKPRELSNREYAQLREALLTVNRLQSLTEKHFHLIL